jgi:hypothetical protein
MSPRTVCKLERFKECSKPIPKTRPWQDFCCNGHRTRFRYLTEKRRRRNRRKRGQFNACCTHSTRFSRRTAGETASLPNALEGLARLRPEFMLRLAAT